MAIKKQLQSKIDGKNVDIYPYTDTEVVYHDGQMLDDVLEKMKKTAGNIFAVVGDNLTVEDSPKLNAELLGGNPPEYYTPLEKLDEYITSDKFNSTLSDYVKNEDIPKNTSDLTNDSGFVTSKELTNQLSNYAKTEDIPKDTNTTYEISKNNSDIILTGSDGSKTSIENAIPTEATIYNSGLMTPDMVKKLSNIEEDANNYNLPTASQKILGGVKSGSPVTSITGLTPCPIIAGVPYYKETEAISDAILEDLGITATAKELNYVDGVTSNIQTQLDNKSSEKHKHTVSDISDFPSSIKPSEHNHSASNITAGTLGGQIIAPTGTDYSTNRIRNAVFTTTDPGEGTISSYPNGSIVFVYE